MFLFSYADSGIMSKTRLLDSQWFQNTLGKVHVGCRRQLGGVTVSKRGVDR
jgi:hypothetical protein